MKTVRDERREDERAQDRRRYGQYAFQKHKDQCRSAADDHADQREECRCFAEFCFRAFENSRDRQSSQKLNGNQETSKNYSLLVAHARIRESCHLTKQLRRGFYDVHRQSRASALAKPHGEIEQWLLADEVY